MLHTKDLTRLSALKECIFIDVNLEQPMVMIIDNGKCHLRSVKHKLYKVKEIEFKKNKKYHVKCICKEVGADVETIKVFRLAAYVKAKDV